MVCCRFGCRWSTTSNPGSATSDNSAYRRLYHQSPHPSGQHRRGLGVRRCQRLHPNLPNNSKDATPTAILPPVTTEDGICVSYIQRPRNATTICFHPSDDDVAVAVAVVSAVIDDIITPLLQSSSSTVTSSLPLAVISRNDAELGVMRSDMACDDRGMRSPLHSFSRMTMEHSQKQKDINICVVLT